MEGSVEYMLGVFSQIRKVYVGELDMVFREENFSPNEINVLIFLANNPSINTGGRLCVCLGVPKGLVCRSIESLRRRGLLDIRDDREDKRVQRVFLSEAAEPLIQRIREAKDRLDGEILGDIPKEEIRQMEETMEKIVSRFQKRGGGRE